MKNAEKILTAMEKAFSGHKIEISYNFNARYIVFLLMMIMLAILKIGFVKRILIIWR